MCHGSDVDQECKGSDTVGGGNQGKRTRRPQIRVENQIELTTIRRHETTMEVTILKKTRTTRMTRIMGRVTQCQTYCTPRTVKTETGSQFLLHNISSEEDTFEGGWYSYCNMSSWRTCRVQKRQSPCQTMTLLEVSPSPQPEDQDSQSHPNP